jgi:cytochrome oxidase Cu insertion factor (SCO1/SenC/PrrC family)
MRIKRRLLTAAAVFLFALRSGLAAEERPRPRQGDLKLGETAPDFTVKDVTGKATVKLSGLKGKPVVLIFGSCT